jgi:surfeit locus 1 family protein
MPAGYSFRPRAWAVALAATACAAGILLGNWQAGRAAEKRAIAARLDQATESAPLQVPARLAPAEDFVLTRVAARGEFRPEHTVLLDNKIRRGRLGYEVLTPLELGNGVHVLVNRGWIEAPGTREVLPRVRTPAGRVALEGLALGALPRLLALDESGQTGLVRQHVRIERFAAETGLALQPFLIEQHSDTHDGLVREWAAIDTGAQKNEMYALQWYSLAALAVVLLVALSFRRAEPAEK